MTAVVLSELINDAVKLEHETYDGIWSEYVLGHNMGETLKLSDVNMQSKQQERILAKFHQSEFNVLVSTSVVEEGLDVRKCNLVVRFDGINNYREYVQSKGRARAQKSQFIVLVEDKRKNEMELDLEVSISQVISMFMFSFNALNWLIVDFQTSSVSL